MTILSYTRDFMHKLWRDSLSLFGKLLTVVSFYIFNVPTLLKGTKTRSVVDSFTIDWSDQIKNIYLPFFQDLSELLEDKIVVLDVGARGRNLAKEWGRLATKVEFYGFELSTDVCQKMQEADKEMGLKSTYIPFAISNKEEKREFYIKKVPTGSSFYTNDLIKHIYSNWRVLRSGKILDLEDRTSIVDTVTVDTVSLDELKSTKFFNKVDFVKIDAEGAELEIVQGGINVIKEALAVQLEVDFVERYNPKNLFFQIDTILNNLNFSFFDFLRFLKTGRKQSRLVIKEYNNFISSNSGQVVGGDVIYLKDPLGPKLINVDSFSQQDLIKLSIISFVLGQFEYAFSIAELLKDKNGCVRKMLDSHFG